MNQEIWRDKKTTHATGGRGGDDGDDAASNGLLRHCLHRLHRLHRLGRCVRPVRSLDHVRCMAGCNTTAAAKRLISCRGRARSPVAGRRRPTPASPRTHTGRVHRSDRRRGDNVEKESASRSRLERLDTSCAYGRSSDHATLQGVRASPPERRRGARQPWRPLVCHLLRYIDRRSDEGH